MRSLFRRLPPFLRVVSVLGLLFPLTALVLGGASLMAFSTSLASSTQPPMDILRISAIGMNLGLLGGACTVVLLAYATRLRQAGRGARPLPSWRSQALTLGLLAALPLCAIVLAVVIPATFPVFALAMVLDFTVSILGDLVLFVAALWVIIATSVELMRPSQTG